jgi:NAD(P) transhydrogenase subunit alpha
MQIGIPNEVHKGERRAATTPEVAQQLQKLGFSVAVENGAGESASYPNEAFREVGVEVVVDVRKLWSASAISWIPSYTAVSGAVVQIPW